MKELRNQITSFFSCPFSWTEILIETLSAFSENFSTSAATDFAIGTFVSDVYCSAAFGIDFGNDHERSFCSVTWSALKRKASDSSTGSFSKTDRERKRRA